jgi:uncharacterized membrane protein YcjF (UPF0283 family)
MMIPNGGTKPVLPPGQSIRDLFNRQVAAQRAGIAQRKHAIRRWAHMGENVKDEERLLGVAERRLRRLLFRRWRAFAILARETSDGVSRLP